MSELTAALATIEKFREITNCPAGVGLQDHLRKLVADNEKAMDSLRQADAVVKLAHEKFLAIAAENVQIKAMNDCLSEELRGYESDGAFEGPNMHLLWWQVETPATDRIVAGIKADGVDYVAHKFRVRAQNSLPVAGWIDAARAAEDFAKQLREGAK